MLKYVSQFFLQIFPSIIATVVGAYIVNYHIIPKTQGTAPKASIASTPDPAKDAGAADTATAEPAAEDAKPKASAEKPAGDKATEKPVAEKPVSETKRAKVAKTAPAIEKAAPAEKPAVTVSIAPPDAPVNIDDKRDANDLARAALDRLRGPVEASRKEAVAAPNPPAAPRVQDQPRVTVASTPPLQPMQPQAQQHMQPLPPAVLITAPSSTGSVSTSPVESQPRRQDRARLTPPGEIPGAPPLDLHAPGHETSITENVVSKARSMIDSVISR